MSSTFTEDQKAEMFKQAEKVTDTVKVKEDALEKAKEEVEKHEKESAEKNVSKAKDRYESQNKKFEKLRSNIAKAEKRLGKL